MSRIIEVEDIWQSSALACAELIDHKATLEVETKPWDAESNGTDPEAEDRHVFRCLGDVWEIVYGTVGTTVKDIKGIRYIHNLMSTPGAARLALEIERACSVAEGSERSAADESVSVGHGFHTGELDLSKLDRGSYDLSTVKAQMVAWERELSIATDPSERADLQDKIRKARAYVSHNENIHGNARPSGALENARKRVTNAISRAKRRLTNSDPTIGAHFENAVKARGNAFVYESDSQIDWTLDQDLSDEFGNGR